MGRSREKMFDKILGAGVGPGHPLTAPALGPEGGYGDPFEVSGVAYSDDAAFVGDHVLGPHLLGGAHDIAPAGGAVFLGQFSDLFPDDLFDDLLAGQDRLQIRDALEQFLILRVHFLLFHAGQLIQPHVENCVGLDLGQLELLHQGSAGFIARFRFAYDLHHQVEIAQRNLEPFQDMGPGLGFVQLELRPADDHFLAVVDIKLDKLGNIHHPRLAVIERQHVAVKGLLQFSVLVQQIDHRLRNHIAFQLDHDTHAVFVRLVAQVGHAFNITIIHQRSDIFNQVGFVDLVRNRGDDDLLFVPFQRFDPDLGPAQDLAPSSREQLLDPCGPADIGAGGKVGSGQHFHQLVDSDPGVVQHQLDRFYNFDQIVGRDISGHTDRDTAAAVTEQVRKFCRQDLRLGHRLVIVRHKVDRLLVQVQQQLHRQMRQPRFGVSHRRRGVAVDRAEVTLAVDQRGPQVKILCHTHQGGVNDRFAVGMIVTGSIAGYLGAFTMFAARRQVEVAHSNQNTPL